MSVQEVRQRHRTPERSDLSDDSERPRPLEIVISKPEHKFELNLENLEKILCREEIFNKPVVVVSVAGAFRKGKSFVLDFFLRYLNTKDKTDENWLGRNDEPLTGFSWRGGVERHTTGIIMWSEPFIMKLPSGKQVAILLVDTQGAFDNQSTVKDCATIFALSTMISSMQVYNLSMMIHENDLQHLHLFTEYGRLALDESDFKPFQSLCFLVRDWSYPYDHPYGNVGGRGYLETVLKLSESQHEEIKLVRKHIRSCFDSVTCYLMPHPGLKVATNPSFDGRLADIDSEFKQYLSKLVPFLLAPENLVRKRLNGSDVTGKGLLECFKAYIKIFESDKLPEPKSMLQATAEANNLAALASAFERYNREMEELCGADKPYLAPEKLQEEHEAIRMTCLEQFFNVPKMGGDVFSSEYMKRLEIMIDESYENFFKRNESKHLMHAYRTPAVLGFIMILSYILSIILDLFGIQSLSQTAVLGLYLPLLLITVWIYVRYSGHLREIGQIIDNFSAVIWEQAIQPVYLILLEKGLQRVISISAATSERKKKSE